MRVKNWEKYQNFKDRRPPWIKLHRELLDDKEFHELPGLSVKVLIFIWLLASEDETKQGCLPSIKKIAFRLRMTEKALESTVSTLDHWLVQDDPNLGTSCHQLGPSETEAYNKEREVEASPLRATVVVDSVWISELGKNPAYQHINLSVEIGKMEAWLALPKNAKRIKTRSFVLHWLNKIEAPMQNGHGSVKPPPPPPKNDPIGRGQWGQTWGDPRKYGYE